MLLRNVEISNFRSLEEVRLDDMGRLAVLIGRNNAGKSAVLEILALVANKVFQRPAARPWPDDVRLVTDHNMDRGIRLDMGFEPSNEDREAFVGILVNEGIRPARAAEMLASPLMSRLSFSFASVSSAAKSQFWLTGVDAVAEDGGLARIIDSQHPNTTYARAPLAEQAKQTPNVVLTAQLLGVPHPMGCPGLAVEFGPRQSRSYLRSSSTWSLGMIARYFESSFFLAPFRHAVQPLTPEVALRLASDGSNLPAVLNHLMSGGDLEAFDEIKGFLHSALPDLGRVKAALGDKGVIDVSMSPRKGFDIPLADMGSGVEQLLMIGTILATEGPRPNLFLEEPESHLHPGAQRFLMEHLLRNANQLVVATHSPLFVDLARGHSTHLVRRRGQRTSIEGVSWTASSDALFDELGVRNSDVLMSDAVLFVEGKTDGQLLRIWSERLGRGLAERTITMISTEGGSNARTKVPVQARVLDEISRRTPVPSLCVVDRDERSRAEMERLTDGLSNLVHVLERREIENYLLDPVPIMAALKVKYQSEPSILSRVAAADEEFVRALIAQAAQGLYGVVLVKRIQAELGSLGKVVQPELVDSFAVRVHDEDFTSELATAIEASLARHVEALNLVEIIEKERAFLDEEWGRADRRLEVAPGAEILEMVFGSFGGKFKKSTDSVRIARHMTVSHIPSEIASLVDRAMALAPA